MTAVGSRPAKVWMRLARGAGDLAVDGGIIPSVRGGLAPSQGMGVACSRPPGSAHVDRLVGLRR